MGTKLQVHNAPQEANDIGTKLQDVFRCPSDNLLNRPKNSTDNNGGRGPYRYSYSLNDNVAMSNRGPQKQGWPAGAGTPPAGGLAADDRSWGKFTGKISSIKRASDILLFVCEDELTIDDGVFSPRPYNWGNGNINAVATRHDLKLAKAKGSKGAFGVNNPNENGFGNVSFCDGHAERISRVDALRQVHSGNPYPDPNSPPFN
jgi:prepilin-type processing-associated H-X9-DG protein